MGNSALKLKMNYDLYDSKLRTPRQEYVFNKQV